MRQFLSVLLLLLSALPAAAALRQYVASLDDSRWQLGQQSPLRCELEHPIPAYGKALFYAEASHDQQIMFELQMWQRPGDYQDAMLVSLPPLWQPGQARFNMGNVPLKKQFNPDAPTQTAWFMLTELEKGRMPTLYYADWQNPRDRVAVSLSAVNFHQAYQDFSRCISQLLPYSFEDIAYTVLTYESNSDKLTPESQKRLQRIATYLKYDPAIAQVSIDAYTDSYGGRWPNLQLSKRRAEAISAFFVEAGIARERISITGHGERRHAAPNDTVLGRATNRRVVIRMRKS